MESKLGIFTSEAKPSRFGCNSCSPSFRGEYHPLTGCNHHAAVEAKLDAEQLTLLELFLDIYILPGELVHWKGPETKDLGPSYKRQLSMEEYLGSVILYKKPRQS